MSGYLARLAASVHGRRSAIRPVVTPLYATQTGAAEPSESPVEADTPSGIDAAAAAPATAARLGAASLAGAPAGPPEAASPSAAGRAFTPGPPDREPARGRWMEAEAVREEISYAPLMSVHPAALAAAVSLQRPSVPALQSSPPRAGAAREPGEIEIHIGRIEVTAVTGPAASPPPLKPARKAPSLDEYLQRRRR